MVVILGGVEQKNVKERDYILATNLTKARIALDRMEGTLPRDVR